MLADFQICISVPLNIKKLQQVFIFGLKEWKRHTYIYLWLTKALNFLAQCQEFRARGGHGFPKQIPETIG